MEAPHRLSTYNELAEGRVVADPFIRTADASALVPLYVRRSCRARALRGPRRLTPARTPPQTPISKSSTAVLATPASSGVSVETERC